MSLCISGHIGDDDCGMSCCRFDGRRDWVFHGAGGGSCRDVGSVRRIGRAQRIPSAPRELSMGFAALYPSCTLRGFRSDRLDFREILADLALRNLNVVIGLKV